MRQFEGIMKPRDDAQRVVDRMGKYGVGEPAHLVLGFVWGWHHRIVGCRWFNQPVERNGDVSARVIGKQSKRSEGILRH